jgi:hypothetical protein
VLATIAHPKDRTAAYYPAMNGPRRLLIAGLVAILFVLVLKALIGTVLIEPRFAVDLEIPLRAAERWHAGAAPYLATAFTSPPGATQPFLYPPFLLPVLGLLTGIPRQPLGFVAVATMLLAATAACRRLGIPWLWIPLVLVWPPFAESIFGGNIQTILFAAFVYVFYRGEARAWTPLPRHIGDLSESTLLIGGLATLVGAIKVSQPQPWLYVMHHRPRAALMGAVAAIVLVGSTIPFTGIELWFDWLAQLRRAADPAWDLGGFALPRFLPPGVGLVIAILSVLGVWFVPPHRAGAWVGLLSVVGSLSLHIFGLLFLVPVLLMIRREAALLAAICIATYSYEGAWAGIVVCGIGLIAAECSARRGVVDEALAVGSRTPTA